MEPPENEVYDDFVPPLLPSDYDRNDEYDNKYEDTDMPTQHLWMVIFLQQPLSPISILVSPCERVSHDITFTTSWRVPIARH